MAIQPLHVSTFLILLAGVLVVESDPPITLQVIYQKLEDALIADSGVLHLMQEVFFPSQSLSQDLVYLSVCVTVCGMQPGSCGITLSYLVDTVTSHTARDLSGAVWLYSMISFDLSGAVWLYSI